MNDNYYHQGEVKLRPLLDSLRDEDSRDSLGLVKSPRKPWKEQDERIQGWEEKREKQSIRVSASQSESNPL